MDAPTVFAMVLRHNIADIALSGCCLRLLRRAAPFTPCSSRPVIYDKGVESNVASSIEHSAESTIEASIII